MDRPGRAGSRPWPGPTSRGSPSAVLLDPESHAGATYDLTGPESLTLTEAAGIISEATGSDVTFHDETVAEAYESRRKWEAPDWQYDAWVSTYTAIAAGEVAAVTDDVRRVTGRAPVGLRELLAAGTARSRFGPDARSHFGPDAA